MSHETKRLTNDELMQIHERTEKATEGPWRIGKQSPNGANNVGTLSGLLTAQTTNSENAVFIASARTDIPKLLLHITQQEIEIDTIQEYKSTIRNMDALADSIRYGVTQTPSSTTYVVDEIVRLISELEEKVGDIT